ncbi:MAG: CFI-box-CTERM domain-containing protein [Thermodesulfobacteriota bacterium]|nr:CFI-box-CTERM domain-containing protein [Thermodesulfobacteriota bacterium]
MATAAFGSPIEKSVVILKDFRDNCLLTNSFGYTFVMLYYKYSPPVADFIAKHETLQAAVRIGLIPLIAFGYLALHFGPISTISMMVAFFVLAIFTISFLRKKVLCHKV